MIASVLLSGLRVLLADEPTTALDVTTQSDVLAVTDELRREQAVPLLFVTHDLDLAMAICDRVAVLHAGAIMEIADVQTVAEGSLHPYTRGLLASRLPLTHRLRGPQSPEAPPICCEGLVGSIESAMPRVAMAPSSYVSALRKARDEGSRTAGARAEGLDVSSREF
jgi:ABC-type dipeptide/oligopeptide/nickel transport system ATPase component